jgi:8-oxo-dGTP diphosphatase
VAHDFRLVPAAYVALRRADSVLLQLRRNTGFMDDHWAMAAAGHVEEGESVYSAGCREAREELGIDVEPAALVPLCGMHRSGSSRPIDQRVDFFFECWRWSGEPHLVESHKAADLRWFALTALPEPVVPHERLVLEGLAAGSLPPVVTFGSWDG